MIGAKGAALHALAPNGNELPFVIAQGALLAVFVWIGVAALKRFPSGARAPAFG